MPFYCVKAIERFDMETTYEKVEAETPEEAVRKCKAGEEAYDKSSPRDCSGDDWVETLSVEEVPCA